MTVLLLPDWLYSIRPEDVSTRLRNEVQSLTYEIEDHMKKFAYYLVLFVVIFALGRLFGLHTAAAYEAAGALTVVFLLADTTISTIASADARIARQLYTGKNEEAVMRELEISSSRFASYARRMDKAWYRDFVNYMVKRQNAASK
jgi:hypothetical protein